MEDTEMIVEALKSLNTPGLALAVWWAYTKFRTLERETDECRKRDGMCQVMLARMEERARWAEDQIRRLGGATPPGGHDQTP